MEDTTFMFGSGGRQQIWNDEWAENVDVAIRNHGKERTPMGEMVAQRIGDLEGSSCTWARCGPAQRARE